MGASAPPALGGTVCLEHLGFWVSFGCDGSTYPSSGQGWLCQNELGTGPPLTLALGHPWGLRSWWGEWGCRTTHLAAPIALTKPPAPANSSLNVPPLCLVFPFHITGLCFASSHPAPAPQGGGLGPAGDPGAATVPFAHRVLRGRQSWCRNVGLGGSRTWDRRSLPRGLAGRFVPSAVGRGERSGVTHHGAAVCAAGAGRDERSHGPG